MSNNKKKLSAAQSEELLKIIKARFEKNKNRHKGIEWDNVQTKLNAHPDKLWSLNEMERTGGEPDVLATTNRRATTFFMIAQRRVPKGAEVFATIAKRWSRGKNTNQKTTLLIWQLRWGWSF